MASEKVGKVKVPKVATAPKATRRPKGSVSFGDSTLNATRAWEAARSLGATGGLDEFRAAYNKTSRRRKAKLNDPAFLRARLAALEGNGSPATDVPQVTHYEVKMEI